jgi:hypothetical protein
MASRLQDVILRGLSAARPVATTTAPGTLYFSTDLGIIERSDGTVWASYSGSGGGSGTTRYAAVEMVVDGGGSVITTGLKGYLEVPFNSTILTSTLLADVSGSIVIDIWKVAYASAPPLVGNTIVASAPPTIASSVKAQDTTLTGWSTAVTAGDIFAFNVNSVLSIKRVTLSLKLQVT